MIVHYGTLGIVYIHYTQAKKDLQRCRHRTKPYNEQTIKQELMKELMK